MYIQEFSLHRRLCTYYPRVIYGVLYVRCLQFNYIKYYITKATCFNPACLISLPLVWVLWFGSVVGDDFILNLTLEGPCIISAIYIQSNEIHNVVALIKFLLVLRCQLYMFRTVTVHPQELLCRYCMCRLRYMVRDALSDTSSWYNSFFWNITLSEWINRSW